MQLDRTPKQRVLAKYPDAVCREESDHFWRVTAQRKGYRLSLGVEWTARAAWADAAKHLGKSIS
jgi:hypothetical protein